MSKSSSVQLSDKVIGLLVPLKHLNNHQGASVTSLDFNDSGQYLISAGVDRSIQLYDVHKGTHNKDIQSQKYGAHCAKFAHHELDCLYASTPEEGLDVDHSVRHLALSTKTYLRYFKGHKDQVTSLEVNPVSETFLSSSIDRTVKLWDFRSTGASGSLDVGQPSVVAYDPQGIVFAVGTWPDPSLVSSRPARISFYDLSNYDKAPFLTAEVPIIPGATWNKIEFSNNGKLVLASTDTHEHYVLDAFSGQLLTTLIVDVSRSSKEYHGDYMSFDYPSTGLACFSPDGKFVIAGNTKGKLCTFDLTSIKCTEGGVHQISPEDNSKRLLPFKQVDGFGLAKVVLFNPKLLTVATADTSVVLWGPNAEEL